MLKLKLKTRAYRCNVMNVTSGDYVDVGGTWIKIVSNSAYNLPENPLPKTWSVVCEDGKTYGPAKTKRFARVSDLEDVP